MKMIDRKRIAEIFLSITFGLILFIIGFYPNESRVKDLSAQAAQSAICPIKEDLKDIKEELRDLNRDIKAILKRN